MGEVNTFTCYVCEKVYDKEITDEEAEQELQELYPGYSTEDCEIVCDDCYKKYYRG